MALPRVVDTDDLAIALSIDDCHVRRLTKRGILQRGEMGFDLVDSIAAYVAHRESVAATAAGAGEFGRARSELYREKAHAARPKREEIEGSLVKKSDTLAAWSAIVMMTKNLFLALPSRAAPILAPIKVPAQIKELLDGMVREILENLSNVKVEAIRPSRATRKRDAA